MDYKMYLNQRVNKLNCCCEKGDTGAQGPPGDKVDKGEFSGSINQHLIPKVNGKNNGGYSLGNEDNWFSDIWAKEGHFSSGSISIGGVIISSKEINGSRALVLPTNTVIGEAGEDGALGAALQEVDRQLQTEKARNDSLEARILALESL